MWRSYLFSVLLGTALLVPCLGEAQTLHQETKDRWSAEVLEVVDEYDREITGTTATATVQIIRATLTEGERAGEVIRFENELTTLQAGDKIFVNHMQLIDGDEYFSYADFERRPALLFLSVLFVVLLLIFSGWQGVRALLSLAASVLGIFF